MYLAHTVTCSERPINSSMLVLLTLSYEIEGNLMERGLHDLCTPGLITTVSFILSIYRRLTNNIGDSPKRPETG